MTDLLSFRQHHLACWLRAPPSRDVPLGSAVCWEAGRCFWGCGKGRASIFLSFLPSPLSCSLLSGPDCPFPSSSWARPAWEGGGRVRCQHTCHLSPSLLASPSFWPPAEVPSHVCHGLVRRWEHTEPGFPFTLYCAVHSWKMG